MSASREKKSRQENLAGGYVDSRTKREKDEQAKDRRSNALYIAIAVIFVIVGIVVTVANSKVIERSADAVTIGNHEFDHKGTGFAEMLNSAKAAQQAAVELLLVDARPLEDMDAYRERFGPVTPVPVSYTHLRAHET